MDLVQIQIQTFLADQALELALSEQLNTGNVNIFKSLFVENIFYLLVSFPSWNTSWVCSADIGSYDVDLWDNSCCLCIDRSGSSWQTS